MRSDMTFGWNQKKDSLRRIHDHRTILVIDLNASLRENQSIHTFSLMIYDFRLLKLRKTAAWSLKCLIVHSSLLRSGQPGQAMPKCLCPLRRQIWDILTSRDLLPTLTITRTTREKNPQSSLMNEWMQFAFESDPSIQRRNYQSHYRAHPLGPKIPAQAVTHAHDRAYIYHVHIVKGMILCTWLSTSSPAILMLTLLITWPSMLPWSPCVTVTGWHTVSAVTHGAVASPGTTGRHWVYTECRTGMGHMRGAIKITYEL